MPRRPERAKAPPGSPNQGPQQVGRTSAGLGCQRASRKGEAGARARIPVAAYRGLGSRSALLETGRQRLVRAASIEAFKNVARPGQEILTIGRAPFRTASPAARAAPVRLHGVANVIRSEPAGDGTARMRVPSSGAEHACRKIIPMDEVRWRGAIAVTGVIHGKAASARTSTCRRRIVSPKMTVGRRIVQSRSRAISASSPARFERA